MSKLRHSFMVGDPVTVYGRWPGTIKGAHTATSYVVQYHKGKSNLVGFVEASQLKPRKINQEN